VKLAACGKITNLYVSQDQWQVSHHTSCLRTPTGGNYTFYSATKDRRLIMWTSEGGNGVRDYTIISTNLVTQSYIQYEAGLGIRGNGFVNSLVVKNLNGKDIIPLVNVLTILDWENGFDFLSQSGKNSKCDAAIQATSKQIEKGWEVVIRTRVHITSALLGDATYLANRPLGYTISLGGIAASGIMNSPQLMHSISSDIINACSSVSSVSFNVSETDWTAIYGLFEQGQVKRFQCVKDLKPTNKIHWGYIYCL
jgi:hypothetical protein